MKKFWFFVTRLAFTFGGFSFIIFLFWDRWPDVLSILKSIRIDFFLASFVVFVLSLLVITFRLKFILSVQKVMVSIRELFYFGLIGHFFNVFLPSAVGGDAVKAYYTYKRSGRKLASFSSVLLDRGVGCFGIISLALVASLFYGKYFQSGAVRNTLIFMISAAFVTVLVLFSRRVGKKLSFFSRFIPSAVLREKFQELYQVVHSYRYHKGVLLKTFLISIAAQSVFIFTHYFLALSLGLPLSPGLFFVVVPVIGLVSMAPSINGLGVREAAFVYFFRPFVGAEKALALSLAYDALIYSCSFLFGILYLWKGGHAYREMKSMTQDSESRRFYSDKLAEEAIKKN